jgi:GGDEF domain-containing protein
MQQAKLPENEAARLDTLRSLNILNTPRDDRFDRYTRIAARIFDMPIALISLVDESRQWFKSVQGFDGKETPREFSFCAHAIHGDDVFEVRNTRRDSRFRDNPLVLEQPHIRYYAGAPLRVPNGHRIGTLCVIDRVPRQLRDVDKAMLKDLADMVVDEMIGYVDAETDLANRHALTVNGTRLFEHVANESGLSLLLFDISDTAVGQGAVSARRTPGAIFADLLRGQFPTAESIAHIGGYRFCVLLKDQSAPDIAKAANHLCAAARDKLSGFDRRGSASGLVGRVQFNPNRHATFDDMLRDADGLFFNYENPPLPDYAESNRFVDAVINWRKTIF